MSRPSPQKFRGINRGLYLAADHLARSARRNTARQRDVWAVRRYFRPGFAWYEAVKTACECHDVDFDHPFQQPLK